METISFWSKEKSVGIFRLLFIPLSRSCLVSKLRFLMFWICRLIITICTNCSSSMNVLSVTVRFWKIDVVRFLDRAVNKLSEFLHSTFRRKMVMTNLQYLLQNLFMSLARILKLSLLIWVSFPDVHEVRKQLQCTMQRSFSNPIRQRILETNSRCTWPSAVMVGRAECEACQEILKLQSLHVIYVSLRLPQFPIRKTSQKQLSRAWTVLTNQTRTSYLSESPCLQPSTWQRMESPVYEALVYDLVLEGDDRDGCKMWCVDGCEILRIWSLDPAWNMRRHVTSSDVCLFSVARDILGQLTWLWRREPGRVWSPSIIPLIKSKCLIDDGSKSMLTQGRWLLPSCVTSSTDSRDQTTDERTWSVHLFRVRHHHIDEMMRGIQVHSDMRWKCWKSLHQMSLVVTDIDKTFETCKASGVMLTFEFFRVKFTSLHDQWIWIRKIKKEVTTIQLRTGRKNS